MEYTGDHFVFISQNSFGAIQFKCFGNVGVNIYLHCHHYKSRKLNQALVLKTTCQGFLRPDLLVTKNLRLRFFSPLNFGSVQLFSVLIQTANIINDYA